MDVTLENHVESTKGRSPVSFQFSYSQWPLAWPSPGQQRPPSGGAFDHRAPSGSESWTKSWATWLEDTTWEHACISTSRNNIIYVYTHTLWIQIGYRSRDIHKLRWPSPKTKTSIKYWRNDPMGVYQTYIYITTIWKSVCIITQLIMIMFIYNQWFP